MLRGARVLVLVVVSVFVGQGLGQHDQTVTSGAKGAGVVEAVGSRIEASCVFSDDKLFSRRLAYVESYDGLHPDAFRAGYYGGIWQVDKVMFDATKQSSVLTSLRTTIQAIKTAFGIDWATVTWQDLTKPLHSAIGARLYLLYKAGATKQIPRSISEQGTFWVTYYRPGQQASRFVDEASRTEKVCSNTKGADIVFILDESGSVGSSNFLKVKTFVKDVVKAFNVGLGSHQSRIAVTTYSSAVRHQFDFKKYTTQASVLSAVDKITYYGGGTETDLALNQLATNIFTATKGARPKEDGHPRVGIVVTDGESNTPSLTLAAAKKVHAADITVFAVGVGSSLNMNELQAIASSPSCLHLMLLSNFQEFDSLKSAIEKRTCDAPIIIGPGDPIDVEPGPGDGQNCKIKVPVGGITIQIEVSYGELTFFTSSATYPSSDYFEKKISAKLGRLGVLFLTRPLTNGTDGIIFCNIKGDNETSGGIGGVPGDQDKCKNKNCHNGGECVQNKAGHSWCECHHHYTGQNCESVINNCASNPCSHGQCVNSVGSYHCNCDSGYTGQRCDQIINNCSPSPCVNGRCSNSVGSYSCHCNDGYTGKHCDEVVDNCSPNPCVHGLCSNSVGSFSCSCDTGYTGERCDIVVDNCSPNPCVHGQCSNSVGSHSCRCDTGYTGERCDIVIDNCSPNPCAHGECSNSVGSYSCSCDTGYTGQRCDIVIDNCSPNPCVHGQCSNSVGSYSCSCDAGYIGQRCDTIKDNCSPNPCVHGQCSNSVGSYSCSCDAGFTGQKCDTGQSSSTVKEIVSSYSINIVGHCQRIQHYHRSEINLSMPSSGFTTSKLAVEKERPDEGYNCVTNNPCTQANINNGRFYFPHSDPSKFVQCSEWGQCFVMSCGAGTVWDDAAQTCNFGGGQGGGAGGGTGGGTGGGQGGSQGGYNCATNNPCTQANIDTGKFYYPHTDPSKFVQCSEWLQCFEMSCGPGTVWDDSALTCNVPGENPPAGGGESGGGGSGGGGSGSGGSGGGGDGGQGEVPGGYNCGSNNPCTQANINTGKFYYPHTDPSKFVQCSEWLQCFEMSCGPGTEWDDAILTCNWPKPRTSSSTTTFTTTTFS